MSCGRSREQRCGDTRGKESRPEQSEQGEAGRSRAKQGEAERTDPLLSSGAAPVPIMIPGCSV